MEILEAGTGHGGLTLHLARAIHAANALRSNTNSSSRVDVGQLASRLEKFAQNCQRPGPEDDLSEQSRYSYEPSSDDRQAVIHTLDLSWKHSKHAEQIVKGFRRGLYANDIVFHVGDVSTWIDEQITNRGLGPDEKAFLSHIVLDMPSPSLHVEKAASALMTNGSLLTFNPSITQIISMVKMVKQLSLPLILSNVLELGLNVSGGKDCKRIFQEDFPESKACLYLTPCFKTERPCSPDLFCKLISGLKEAILTRACAGDVRTVIPRALLRNAKAHIREDDSLGDADGDSDDSAVADTAEASTADRDNEPKHDQISRMEIVCRPKVGYRVAGGGFLGVWKKMKH